MIHLLFLVLIEDGWHEEEDGVAEEPQEAALKNKQITWQPAFLSRPFVGELSVTCVEGKRHTRYGLEHLHLL